MAYGPLEFAAKHPLQARSQGNGYCTFTPYFCLIAFTPLPPAAPVAGQSSTRIKPARGKSMRIGSAHPFGCAGHQGGMAIFLFEIH